MNKFLAGGKGLSADSPPSRENSLYYVSIYLYILYIYIYVYIYIVYVYVYRQIDIAFDHEITQAMQFAEISFQHSCINRNLQNFIELLTVMFDL